MRDLLPIREGHVLHVLCDRLLRDGGDVGRERSRSIWRHKAFALPFRIGGVLLPPAWGGPGAPRGVFRWGGLLVKGRPPRHPRPPLSFTHLPFTEGHPLL